MRQEVFFTNFTSLATHNFTHTTHPPSSSISIHSFLLVEKEEELEQNLLCQFFKKNLIARREEEEDFNIL